MTIRPSVLLAAMLPLLGQAHALELSSTLQATELPNQVSSLRFSLFDAEDAATPVRVLDYAAGEFRITQMGEAVRLAGELDEDLGKAPLWIETEANGRLVGQREPFRAASLAVTFAVGQSVNMGVETTVADTASTAMGYQTQANNFGATSLGQGTIALGVDSLATGAYSLALGQISTALGYNTLARSAYETAIGRLNTDYAASSTTDWVATDRLFVIGNGVLTPTTIRSDALVMLKNGNTTLNGQLSISNWAAAAGTAVCRNGNTLSTCTAGALGDNLGNHTATTNIKLNGFYLSNDGSAEGISIDNSGRVGVGAPAGSAALTIGGVDGLLATGVAASGNIPATGPGTRLMWYPNKSAFRAGTVNGAQWDDSAVGSYSLATGLDTVASGDASSALGLGTKAQSYGETVVGMYNELAQLYSSGSRQDSDRLFVIGNGINDGFRTNALVMLKNGDTTLNGQLTVTNLPGGGSDHVCVSFGNNTLQTCSSSGRYKDEIHDLPLGLETVAKLRPVSFKWKSNERPDLGFVAEEVEAIDPLLATHKDGRVEGVKYSQLTALLVNAVKQQQAEIESLRAELGQYRSLAAEVAELRQQVLDRPLMVADRR